MHEFVAEHLTRLEQDANIDTRAKVFRGLRELGLDDFGEILMSMPMPEYPKLAALLPRMASKRVQESWTGSSGLTLLMQTLAFVRSLSCNYARLVGRSLSDASILDYGCGYGRIARLMYYFADEDCVFGCDPWDESIDICKQDGLGDNFLRSAYLPESLPLGARKFDLIYAFSVFTHLSEKSARISLSALRKYLKDDGLLVITIRPVEYWGLMAAKIGAAEAAEFRRVHGDSGFAFRPHVRLIQDGESNFGDTSLTFDWLAANIREWEMVAIDRSLTDRFQIYVFLKPRAN